MLHKTYLNKQTKLFSFGTEFFHFLERLCLQWKTLLAYTDRQYCVSLCISISYSAYSRAAYLTACSCTDMWNDILDTHPRDVTSQATFQINLCSALGMADAATTCCHSSFSITLFPPYAFFYLLLKILEFLLLPPPPHLFPLLLQWLSWPSYKQNSVFPAILKEWLELMQLLLCPHSGSKLRLTQVLIGLSLCFLAKVTFELHTWNYKRNL